MSDDYHHTPYPPPVGRPVLAGDERFFAYQTLQTTVEYVAISYRLTLTGVPTVETVPSWREPSLPEDSIRMTLGDDVVVLTVDEWGGRGEELDTWLRTWIIERVSWTRAGLAGGRRHKDAGWTRVLRERAPWR